MRFRLELRTEALGGVLLRDADFFLAADFFATGDFLGAVFLAEDFFTGVLARDFLTTGDFLGATFLAEDFLATFLAEAFLTGVLERDFLAAGDFFVADFFAAGFFVADFVTEAAFLGVLFVGVAAVVSRGIALRTVASTWPKSNSGNAIRSGSQILRSTLTPATSNRTKPAVSYASAASSCCLAMYAAPAKAHALPRCMKLIFLRTDIVVEMRLNLTLFFLVRKVTLADSLFY